MRLLSFPSAAWLILTLLLGNLSGKPSVTALPTININDQGMIAGEKTGGTGYHYVPLPEPNHLVQEMIDQVDEEILSQLVGDLSGEWPVTIGGEPYTIQSRHSYSGEPVQKASEYLYEYYRENDVEVGYQDFSIGEIPLRNVIAEIPGSLAPDQVFMISSHYDSAPFGSRAPGADDDASGTAAVMLAARIFSQYDFGCTIRFVNFSGEEQGLVGSQVSARDSFCQDENIRAVLNLDMIGWNSPESPLDMELHTEDGVPGSEELAFLYQDVVETYGLDLQPEIVNSGISASDHASYWSHGFPAILVIEDLDDFNPNYHTSKDRLGQLDLSYFSNMVKASLGTMAHLSCLVDSGWGTILGSVVDGSDGSPITGATISFYHPEWDVLVRTTSNQDGEFVKEIASASYYVSADAPGYAPQRIGLVMVSPTGNNIQDIVLQPARESLNYLPLVQDPGSNPLCR